MKKTDEKIEKRVLSLEEELYRTGLAVLAVSLPTVWITLRWILPNIPQTDCVFATYMGVYCPGCGGTRAVIAFFHGHFLQSLWYHPIVMYAAVTFGMFMLSHTLEKLHFPFVRGMKFNEWLMYGALVVIAVNFILKNVLKFCFGVLMLSIAF